MKEDKLTVLLCPSCRKRLADISGNQYTLKTKCPRCKSYVTYCNDKATSTQSANTQNS